MGSPNTELCRDSMEELHQVTLTNGFYLQQTEVTQQQWLDVFGTNPSIFLSRDRPVENITWYDACVFCNRLSLAWNLIPSYYEDAAMTKVFDGTPPVKSGPVYWNQNADGYRLPTEAEWEYACRAETMTPYNNGQTNTACEEDTNLDQLAWYFYNSNVGSGGETHDVGLKQSNNWNLYDMHGNVGEYCWDWYKAYPPGSATNPKGPAAGATKIIRGGSWQVYAEQCRSASRYYISPGTSYYSFGFRLARNGS
ncbi:formylglycine-generating enzyme family protein [bacterium]|nr:formylglycine-generating enzyme family protein [bacterium]